MSAACDRGDDDRDDNPRRSRGVALVAVLWISSLLALLAAGAASSSRTDLRLAANAADHARARALADAGVQQAVFQLLTRPEAQPWRDGAVSLQFALDGGDVRFRLQDEDAKLDVNAASKDLLAGLFQAVGLDEEGALTLADRLEDFRDEDDDPEPRGAEDDDYLAAGYPRGALDRRLLDVSELTGLLGMSDDLYQRVEPFLTVYADADGIDPTRAPATVLLALPGMSPDLAATLAAAPADGDPLEALPEDLADDIQAYLIPSRDLVFSIESLGTSEGGGRFMREAVVALDGGVRHLPYTLYAWHPGRLPSPEPGDR
ncbi:MAG: type II secretion system protein GspK [Alphaproteobacteria bacterium]